MFRLDFLKLDTFFFRALRQRCQRYFSDLVPGRRIDIVAISPDGHVEKGLKFVLLDNMATSDEVANRRGNKISEVAISDKVLKFDEDVGFHKQSHKSTEELSGGQRALLGLSFVFAAALHKRSPLYLLDEVLYTAYDTSSG